MLVAKTYNESPHNGSINIGSTHNECTSVDACEEGLPSGSCESANNSQNRANLCRSLFAQILAEYVDVPSRSNQTVVRFRARTSETLAGVRAMLANAYKTCRFTHLSLSYLASK